MTDLFTPPEENRSPLHRPISPLPVERFMTTSLPEGSFGHPPVSLGRRGSRSVPCHARVK